MFAPYNYIIDPLIREACDIDLEGCVVVFDEGGGKLRERESDSERESEYGGVM